MIDTAKRKSEQASTRGGAAIQTGEPTRGLAPGADEGFSPT